MAEKKDKKGFSFIEGDENEAQYRPKYAFSSGSFLLDANLKYNGYTSGAIVQHMSGKEGSFKTAMSILGAANFQKKHDIKVGFVDAEHDFDIDWARNIGLSTNKSNFMYGGPQSGEDAFAMVESMIVEHNCKAIIIDSLDACQPTIYHDNEYGDNTIGQHAKLVGKFMIRARWLVNEHDATIWIVNQMRDNITSQGVMGKKPQGGARVLFYSKLNLQMERASAGKIKDMPAGIVPLTLKIERSKWGNSFVEIETTGIQGKSIDYIGELVQMATDLGLLVKKGSWFKDASGVAIGQGAYSQEVRDWAENNQKDIIKLWQPGSPASIE